jgi:hypothetical protein
MDFAWGQSGLQPSTWVEEPDFHLMLSSQVPIHVSNGVASFGRRAQVTFDIATNRICGSGCGDPVVLHVSDKGIHDLILASMKTRRKSPSHPGPARISLGHGPVSDY